MRRTGALLSILAVSVGCSDRPLPIEFVVDASILDLQPMKCGGQYQGAIAGRLDETAGCAVFVVDDDAFSIFALDSLPASQLATAHALLDFPPEIRVRGYALGDVASGRVSLDGQDGRRWVAGVSAAGSATGALTLRIDSVGAGGLDARGRHLFIVHGALDATLLGLDTPPTRVQLQVSF